MKTACHGERKTSPGYPQSIFLKSLTQADMTMPARSASPVQVTDFLTVLRVKGFAAKIESVRGYEAP